LKDVLDHIELTDIRLLGTATDNASSTQSTISELQSPLQASGIEWPALRNHIPCVSHIILLALGAFMSCLSGKGCTKSWEANECDQQFGANESIHIGKSQRLPKVVNGRINKVLAIRPGFARIIEKIRIS